MENTETAAAEPVVEASSESVETTDQADQSSGELWDTPLIPEAPTEDQEPVAEETSTPEVNESAEENTTVEDSSTVVETDEEEEPEEETLTAQADKPAPLSRRKLRDVEEKVITPFRDPDAPVRDVLNGLREINPERANELASELVHDAVKAYPNEWLEYLTGIEGITPETVKQKFSGNDQPQPDAFQQVISKLDEVYGEAWRDPSQDDYLLDEDREVVMALRNHLTSGQTVSDEKDAQIKALEEKLEKLQPEIADIRTQQEAEFEARVQNLKSDGIKEYTKTIESRSLPKLLEDSGLKVTESDTDGVKAVKNFIQSQFKPEGEWMSNFEQFAVSEFSGREDLSKMVQRVDKYLDEAYRAEAKAAKEGNKEKKSEYLRVAETRKADAKQEQDRLVVQHRKASKEFLDKLKPLMDVLEENAHLQKQITQGNFRPEIIGQAATAGATTYREKISKAEDPWAVPFEGI